MHATGTNIWRVPVFLPYLQPELTRSALLETEKQIGFKLPENYIELLAEQNGGYIRWRLYGEVHDTIRGIGPCYPSLEAEDWSIHGDWLPFDLSDGKFLVPFDGDGHWHLCLDYRRHHHCPSITKVDTEGIKEEAIAGSFADYLEMLEPAVEENEFVLLDVSDIAAVKSWLCKALRMESSVLALGDTDYRLLREREDSPECVWLSPNLVPRGHVRADDPRYLELKDLLPGSARRYPGLADSSWILSASECIVPEVLTALSDAGVEWTNLTPEKAFLL